QLGISATLADRVRMWRAPWDNVARGGDQIAQALWAMASGATFGSGPGLGDTRYLPAGHTDLILASISEELGFAGLVAIALADAAPSADLSAFAIPVRWVSGGLGAAAVLLLGIAAVGEVRHADELIGRPHLGLQADGMRRFQYNPRLLDLVSRIPRGTIVVRN